MGMNKMRLSEILIKVIGIILAIVGLGLLLSTVGIGILGIGLSPWWISLLVGILFLSAGIYIIRGGTITL